MVSIPISRWRIFSLIVAGILYFLTPIDLIPDFLFGVGLVDDAAVLAWVMHAIQRVLDDFAVWESNRPSAGGRD